jgi:hypothetical protein
MAESLVLHKGTVSIGGATGATTKEVFFLAPKDTYTGLTDETGIKEAASDDKDEVPFRVPDLLAKGYLFRLTVGYEKTGKLRVAKILVAKDKIGVALNKFNSDSAGNIRGGKIKSARIPRRMSFY